MIPDPNSSQAEGSGTGAEAGETVNVVEPPVKKLVRLKVPRRKVGDASDPVKSCTPLKLIPPKYVNVPVSKRSTPPEFAVV
jgi:hypothetical protein